MDIFGGAIFCLPQKLVKQVHDLFTRLKSLIWTRLQIGEQNCKILECYGSEGNRDFQEGKIGPYDQMLEKHYKRRDIQIVKKHMKRCPTLLVTREMQIKTTMSS